MEGFIVLDEFGELKVVNLSLDFFLDDLSYSICFLRLRNERLS